MPRSKRTIAFGPEYEQLLLRWSQAPGGSLTLQLQTPNAAHSLRSKLYAYFAALRHENTRPDLIRLSDMVALRCASSALVVYHRDDSWDAEALRNALGLEKGFAEGAGSTGIVMSPSAQSAALEKLAEIRKRK